ncbi:GAF domain-containing SpoIIE family protein phosphatase [Nocardioides mesophilus]|uniref:SpoIIE family protein phosphatase n=1 Tax=Nocardioides mesophilus TaxID=433659 RepID=A0A7G9R7K6_9ACTN|nr:GAF domain-containing SpoIIE family protein phosphatase [Nocardioides mesophilus]QNN51581.1 SpoIIE family protein phosphatase [Nocardioides mesophilus]
MDESATARDRVVVVPRTEPLVIDLGDPGRLAAVTRLLPATAGNATLDRLCALAARLLGTGSAQVSLLSDAQLVAAGAGLGRPVPGQLPSPLGQSLCTVTAASGRPLVVDRADADARVCLLEPVTSGSVGAYLGVPLRDDEDRVIGALCVFDPEPRAWLEDQVAVLEELAPAVVAELERAAAVAERDRAQFRLGVAISAGGIGSWEWQLGPGELHADERTMSMFGLPVGPQVLGLEELERRVHPLDRGLFVPSMYAAVEAREDYAAELRLLGADGVTRWVVVRGRTLADLAGSPVGLVGAMYETTEQHEAAESATASADLVNLLAAASDLLSGSLEPEDAVRSLTRVVVPRLADWSMVSLVGADGRLEDVECWHHDPELREVTERFTERRLVGRADPDGSLSAFDSGRPFVLESGAVDFAHKTLRDPEARRLLDQLDLESVAALPLLNGGTVIGTITLCRGAGRPPMSPAELATAVDVGRRASTTLSLAQTYGLERQMSEGLQRSLLTEPVQPDHVEVVVRYVPASSAAQVGGDWYDAFMQPDGATLFVVGDVVGHDFAAAAAMGQLRNLLRGIAVASGDSPASVLDQVDHAIETLRLDTTATAVVARLEQSKEDLAAGITRLRWSNAGHPPAVIVDAQGGTRLLADHDLLLGVLTGTERRESELLLERGATLLMYTDGLVERRFEELHLGIERLERTVAELRELPLQEMADELVRRLVPDAPEDDIALLAIRLHPQDRPRPAEAGPVVLPDNIPEDPATRPDQDGPSA